MRLASLFSGGKDSVYATYLAKEQGYKIACLISIQSKNKESYMFHTPSIEQTKKQAEAMGLPLIITKTKGEKEKELVDLEKAIKKAIKTYKIQGVVTGALESVYQSTRIQKICDKLGLECFNPLWQKDPVELLRELVEKNFNIILIGVFAYPLDKSFLGKKIDRKFIEEIKTLYNKYKINPAGEGGEFETFVINCPLFKQKLKIQGFKDYGEKNSWRRELLI